MIYVIIGIILLSFILEFISDVLTLKSLSPNLPKDFEETFDEELYKKNQNYIKDNTKFSIFKSLITTPIQLAFIILGGFNWVDTIARGFGEGEIVTGLIFVAILAILSSLLSLPFTIYHTFVIEERYGFNKTTVKTFILDMIKSIILGAILGGLILGVIFYFFKNYQLGWLYAWIGLVVLTFVIQLIAPVAILPLFNKFTPLEDGELKEKLESFANKLGFKLSGIFSIDGSKRSTKLNAYFTGFGKFKRIALFDTLIEKLSIDEIIAVLGHEIGHFKKKHIFKSLFISILNSGFMFYLLSLFLNNKTIFEAFKMEHLSVYASLIFFGFLYSPISLIISIFLNILSRKHEYEADEYSAKAIKNPQLLIDALKKLSKENFSNLTPHKFNVILHYSHPPLIDRFNALRKVKV